jgi:hypothetical protein
MAQPALHFAVGTTCTTVLTLAVGPLRRRWFRFGPLLAMAGGVWACLPDLDHLLGLLAWPVAGKIVDFESTHAQSWLWNIFFFHGWMDRALAGRGTIIGLLWIMLLVSAFFWLSARRVAKLERRLAERDSVDSEADSKH